MEFEHYSAHRKRQAANAQIAVALFLLWALAFLTIWNRTFELAVLRDEDATEAFETRQASSHIWLAPLHQEPSGECERNQ